MSYEEKVESVKQELLNYCEECIRNNWNIYFSIWINCEAHIEHGYKRIFIDHFGEYVTPAVQGSLWVAAYNTKIAIKIFKECNPTANLNSILNFTKKIITEQMDSLDNWCDDIILAIPDEDDTVNEENPI
jgi:hypothetical protein